MFNKRQFVIGLVIALAIGFGGGIYFNRHNLSLPIFQDIINRDSGQPAGVDFSQFWATWNVLQQKYVENEGLDTQELVYGAIDGLVKSVGDPYTVFFRPKESESFAQEISGTFGGIGIEIGLRDNLLTVIAPISGTPADRAGLLAGDKIIRIGDKTTEGIKLNDAVNMIRGPKGTPVHLTVTREGMTQGKDYTIIRDTIKVPTVAWKMLDDKTAYIQLYVFNRNVDDDFKKVSRDISRSQASRIILDLRNNPGGLLDSSVNIASYFLDTEQVVTIERFGDGREDIYRTQANGQLKNYPLVIIMNKGSASASEILAGALKDHRGVTIVGEQSFGKGSVQEVDDLGGRATIKITVAKWYTPNGTSIDDNGIKPDIMVERTEANVNANQDPQLDKAREIAKNL